MNYDSFTECFPGDDPREWDDALPPRVCAVHRHVRLQSRPLRIGEHITRLYYCGACDRIRSEKHPEWIVTPGPIGAM